MRGCTRYLRDVGEPGAQCAQGERSACKSSVKSGAPLTTQHYPMLQRNLVYTSVIRGNRQVVLAGERRRRSPSRACARGYAGRSASISRVPKAGAGFASDDGAGGFRARGSHCGPIALAATATVRVGYDDVRGCYLSLADWAHDQSCPIFRAQGIDTWNPHARSTGASYRL
jgi:hypothetical protein